MTATFSFPKPTVTAGALVLVAAGAAYLLGASGRPAPAPQTVYALPAANQSGAALPGITVIGVGNVDGTPDTLTVSLTVTQTRSDVSAALSAADASMNAVDAALTGHGVAGADLRTTGAQIQPNYRPAGGIDGYTATESLTATLRDLKSAGSVIGAAVHAGGNAIRLDEVALDLQHDSALMDQARAAAFADAKARAQRYADAAGETLGKPTQITETVNSPAPIDFRADAAVGAAGSQVPISPGTARLSVTVTVVFAAG